MSKNSLKFRRFILHIAKELTSADRAELVYYLSDIIPAVKREALSKIPSGVFEELERRGYIGPGKLKFLQESLKAIFREDLACEVQQFDCSRRSRLTPKSVDYLENSGYRLHINGGKHLVSDKGDDYVHLRSGKSYELVINNFNSHRCKCEVKIDGHAISSQLIIKAGGKLTLERPRQTASHFKFFAVRDAPLDSGIDERNTEQNGCIQVIFTPEVAVMIITCDIGEGKMYFTRCSLNMTDVEFHRKVSLKFSCDSATVLIDGYRPLGKRNIKLVDYGIKNGSRVIINFGLVGGGISQSSSTAERSENNAPAPIEWIPGASTMQGQSEQTFRSISDFVPNNKTRKVALRLRLVARADEIPIPSNGECIPFILGNRHPPPV